MHHSLIIGLVTVVPSLALVAGAPQGTAPAGTPPTQAPTPTSTSTSTPTQTQTQTQTQTPTPGFVSRDIEFPGGAADVTLAATLILPPNASATSKVPGIVLVTGSGAQDRDETIAGKKPFKVLAESLVRRGIAVLRYDDRGTAELKIGKSTGTLKGSTLVDMSGDAAAAIKYLESQPEIDAARIGILGHSTGGLEAAHLLGQNRIPRAAVLLAAPAVLGRDLLAVQSEAIIRAMKKSGKLPLSDEKVEQSIELQTAFIHAAAEDDEEALRNAAEKVVRQTIELQAPGVEIPKAVYESGLANALTPMKEPWMAHFLRYDPGEDLAASKVPVLMVYGGRDIQVAASQNAGPASAALARAGRARSLVVVMPTSNHLFQEAQTGTTDEYAKLPNEMNPELCALVGEWLEGALVGASAVPQHGGAAP